MTVARVGQRVPRRYPLALGRAGRVSARLATIVVILFLWFSYMAPRSIGGPISLIWVSGFSMEPTLYTGDISVLSAEDRYGVGDIVAFDIPEGGTVIHRIIEVHPDGYVFQGDNRDMVDPWLLDESAIRGRQLFAVPKAAEVLTTLRRPAVVAGLVAAMIFIAALRPSAAPEAEGVR